MLKLDILEIKGEKIVAGKNESWVLEKEAERFLSKLHRRDYNIALDVKEREFSTEGFARFLKKKKADFSISFSKMTTSHGLSLLLILEQLLRALDLSAEGKYHQ